MEELAARHGFYMDGRSMTASEEDSGDEIHSYHEGASEESFPAPGWADASRQAEPGTATKSRSHRGVSFSQMQDIFAALVRYYLRLAKSCHLCI